MVYRPVLAFLVLTASLAAQSTLWLPASHANLEGSGSTNVPFGRSTPTRVQYVYDAMLFAGPVTITGVRFRLEGGQTAAPKAMDCEFRMSTLPTSLVGISVDFAANRGADETVVLPLQTLTLPGQTTAATPNPLLAAIPFTTPFAYDPQHGGLVFEIVVQMQPPGAYTLDVTYVCDSPEVPVGPVSCLGSNGLVLRAENGTTQVIWGRPWVALVRDAVPGNLVILALGTIENGPWGGLLLPQDLAAVGAPGCYVSIDAAALTWSIAQPDGSAQFPFVVPNTPLALGEWIRFQAASFDLPANALGLVTSQAQKVQVCGWEPVGRVWAGNLASAFGTREIGLAAVVQLVVQ